ncbi:MULTISPECIES: hypothetical protein [unclassified Azospirillum]|uniref:hypothetical protein n=1 Tax=unclassified Azospirillum TaxID=2630922 RepID=UPI0011B239FB|nr:MULTISPECIES: hypothetical protein [unclassified Azospirillum]
MKAIEIYGETTNASETREINCANGQKVRMPDHLHYERRCRNLTEEKTALEHDVVALMFGDLNVEREELELKKERAEARQTEYEAEQARLEIEQIRAETLATMAAAQKARADAKLTAAKAWGE